MVKHLLRVLVQRLDVLVRIAGQGVAGRTLPNEVLRRPVEQLNNESSNFIVINGCGGHTDPSKPTPSAEPVVERVELLFVVDGIASGDDHVSTGRNFG